MRHIADDGGKYKNGGDVVGLRETLQQALVNANDHRLACHEALQECDSELVQAKANLEKAHSCKLGADEINQTAVRDQQALAAYCAKFEDPKARDALHPAINRLGVEQRVALRNSIKADEAFRRCQSTFTEIENRRTGAQQRLDRATERWEQIRKQVEQISVLDA